LALFSPLPFGIKNRYSPVMKNKVEEVVKVEQIELIVCDSIYQSLHVQFGKCLTVLNEHNVESMIVSRYLKTETNIIKKLYASLELSKILNFENKMWKAFDSYFVCSDIDKEAMEKRCRTKNIKVIPNGVDINEFYPQLEVPLKPFSLIYTGQINWHPNEDALIFFLKEIYPLIKNKVPEVNFWIVGKGPTEIIKRFAEQDKSITVTGFVDDVRPYMLQSQVFVVPLRIGSGTRLKILEAMAMGKAVVSTTIGCEGLAVKDEENILVADKPDVFAEKVVTLLQNTERTKALESAGRCVVEKEYSWDAIEEKINLGIKDVIALGKTV